MAKICNIVLGTAAGVMALGAVQLERARSSTLAPLPLGDASLRMPVAQDVNRAGKADRLDTPRPAAAAATLFVYPLTMPDTLIAARMSGHLAPSSRIRPAPNSPPSPEMKTACEPLMSPLAAAAEAAPGRCMV
jgi:hypothetical protein